VPSPLVIPGVQVSTQFEPSPVLPGATGILGIVGVADRGPVDPTPVGSFAEFVDNFGVASAYSMPEVRAAFTNGVQQVVVARTAPGLGQKASINLLDDDGEPVVTLQARAEGAWGNKIGVQVTQVRTLSGLGVKFVNVGILLNGGVIDSLTNLNLDPESPDYFFDRINAKSRLVVALDTLFENALPAAIADTPLATAQPRAASGRLKAGATDVVRAAAKLAGPAANLVAVRVRDGQAALAAPGAGNAPSILIRARQAGAAGTAIRVTVQTPAPNSVSFVVLTPPASPRNVGPFTTVDQIVAGFANDPDVSVQALGTVLPSALASTQLQRTIDIDVVPEGQDVATYPGLATIDDVTAIADPLVRFFAVNNATQLPDTNPGVPLTGGRNSAPALELAGDTGTDPLLELVLAPNATGAISVAAARGVSTIDNSTGVVNLTVSQDGTVVENFNNLTMDPDDPNYLPVALQSSGLIRAHDLFVRSRATSLPRNLVRPALLQNGTSPSVDDYGSALEGLEQAEEVDLVIASVHNQLSDPDIRSVHQLVAAHASKMADVARNRIGIGSVTASETNAVANILDHANDVRSDFFILTAPTGTEGPVAGLLGQMDYFRSPTFKVIPSLGVAPGLYTDSQLTQLILGNVLAIAQRRNLGIIVVKGLLTSGRQINVQRTVNKSVRDVKATADTYIGLLNNEGIRNALKQQIVAMFLQMERDGAIVPSTDGKDPSFKVDVHSTQADFAIGIVRVDIAVRPVRAIDYIYATIFVQN
jgi:hypothetical protein